MEADEAHDEDADAWSPGMNVARPNGREALGPAAGAGGSNDPLDRFPREGAGAGCCAAGTC